MRDIEYPAMAAHIEQHNELISKLNEVAECIANGTLQTTQLKTFLTSWLVGHIVTFDTKLSAFLSHRKPDAVA
jgi:hemerythrin